MNSGELKQKSNDQLQSLVDGCFSELMTCTQELKPTLMLLAQFYTNEINRRHDARTSRRDFWMEVGVIGLITIEIVISLVALRIGIRDGKAQTLVLEHMENSTGATADTLRTLQTEQKESLDTQKTSLQTIQQMNSAVQGSLKTNTAMNGALRSQLAILKDEQQKRLAEEAKKPRIVARIGTIALLGAITPVPAKDLTATSVVYEITLWNEGTAMLLYGQLHITAVGPGVKIKSDRPSQQPWLSGDVTDKATSIVISFERLRVGVHVSITVTAEFPKGTAPFPIELGLEGDNYPMTVIGDITTTPPKE